LISPSRPSENAPVPVWVKDSHVRNLREVLLSEKVQQVSEDLLDCMCRQIRHRGPDDQGMYVYVEMRCSLLDHHVVEFAAAIPWLYKVRDGETKWILKKTSAGLLPPEIVNRRKQGFAIPINRWFRTALKGYAYETLLLGKGCGVKRYFAPDFVERLLSSHMS
jgi:asparagine synthase (glutamine-hydrolysing)